MPGARTAIICGNGSLPLELAAALDAQGEAPLMVGIVGEADEAIVRYDHETFALTQIGRLFKILDRYDVGRVALAGGVAHRPDLGFTGVDLGTFLTLPRVLSALISGDDTLLSRCIEIIEGKGYEVVGAHEIAPALLVRSGACGAQKLPRGLKPGLEIGRAVLDTMAPHDLGQACIVVGRRVVAVEGAEGTDGLLARTATMRADGRISQKYPSILVKATKAGQDMRIDLPTIGPRTVSRAVEAGISAIAVEAGASLILQRGETIAAADAAKIAIHGFQT